MGILLMPPSPPVKPDWSLLNTLAGYQQGHIPFLSVLEVLVCTHSQPVGWHCTGFSLRGLMHKCSCSYQTRTSTCPALQESMYNVTNVLAYQLWDKLKGTSMSPYPPPVPYLPWRNWSAGCSQEYENVQWIKKSQWPRSAPTGHSFTPSCLHLIIIISWRSSPWLHLLETLCDLGMFACP